MTSTGVGGQASNATIDQSLQDLSVGMRKIMQAAENLSTYVNGGGDGLTFLVDLGYSSTPNANNPGGVSDAQWALSAIGYLSTVAGVYFGTVQAQGSGGTGALLFNFNSGLAPLWGGQVSLGKKGLSESPFGSGSGIRDAEWHSRPGG